MAKCFTSLILIWSKRTEHRNSSKSGTKISNWAKSANYWASALIASARTGDWCIWTISAAVSNWTISAYCSPTVPYSILTVCAHGLWSNTVHTHAGNSIGTLSTFWLLSDRVFAFWAYNRFLIPGWTVIPCGACFTICSIPKAKEPFITWHRIYCGIRTLKPCWAWLACDLIQAWCEEPTGAGVWSGDLSARTEGP